MADDFDRAFFCVVCKQHGDEAAFEERDDAEAHVRENHPAVAAQPNGLLKSIGIRTKIQHES